MDKNIVIPSSIFFALVLSACNTEQQSQNNYVKGPEMPVVSSANNSQDSEHMVITGTIVYNDFEGGFFGFVAKDGTKYTLQNLPPEHNKNGLVIKITAEVINGMMTTTQFGQMLRVHDFEVIDDTQIKPKANEF